MQYKTVDVIRLVGLDETYTSSLHGKYQKIDRYIKAQLKLEVTQSTAPVPVPVPASASAPVHVVVDVDFESTDQSSILSSLLPLL